MVKAILEGQVPGPPDMAFGVVDVRDVADLHIRAMSSPKAVGERFIAVAGPALSLRDVAWTLSKELGERADGISPALLSAPSTTQEGTQRPDASSAKARRILDWSPRPASEAILASAQSLLQLGLIE